MHNKGIADVGKVSEDGDSVSSHCRVAHVLIFGYIAYLDRMSVLTYSNASYEPKG